jgi:hypothetical protein
MLELIEKIKDQGPGVTQLIIKKVDRLYYMEQYDKVLKELDERYEHWVNTAKNFLGCTNHTVRDRNKPSLYKFYTPWHGGYKLQTIEFDLTNALSIDIKYIY